jgi:trehalose/maltose transport system substrate-binding protein
MATQWIASNNASIFKNNSITIASSQAADVLARISSWSNTGIVDAIDFKNADLESSMQRFRDGNSIFLLGNLAQYNALHREPPRFEWGLAPFPGDDEKYFGILGGWNLGVYKYSKNPAAAVKAIQWITSSEAQKESILLSDPIKLLPTRSDLYAGETIHIILLV